MTKDEATSEACAIVALVYRSIGDYASPSDGFCLKCPAAHGQWHFQNQGKALAYVRAAVVEKLARDGHKIADGFGPDGRETVKP